MRDGAACVSDEDSPATQDTISSCRRSAQQLWLYVPLSGFFVPPGQGFFPQPKKAGQLSFFCSIFAPNCHAWPL